MISGQLGPFDSCLQPKDLFSRTSYSRLCLFTFLATQQVQGKSIPVINWGTACTDSLLLGITE